MLGAAIGNIIGTRYEPERHKKHFKLFDHTSAFGVGTICTAAISDWILNGCTQSPAHYLQKWGRRYPHPGEPYSDEFNSWLWQGNPQPYGSFGPGAAMRVSAVGWAFHSLSETLNCACDSAAVTHNHTEGIKGAQAVAAAIFWARTGESKSFIRDNTARLFGYDVGKPLTQTGNAAAHGSQQLVTQAISVFLAGETFEETLWLSLSCGGNHTARITIAASIAEAYYRGIPPHIKQGAMRVLPEDMAAVLLNVPM